MNTMQIMGQLAGGNSQFTTNTIAFKEAGQLGNNKAAIQNHREEGTSPKRKNCMRASRIYIWRGANISILDHVTLIEQ
jgi:hypothetical protein